MAILISTVRQLPRFRQARRAVRELAARETWTRSEIDAYQLNRLNALWARAVIHVPYYRQLARSLSLPLRFDSLSEFTSHVPVLDKDTVRQAANQLVSERTTRGRWYSTGGSTGTPLRIWWAHDNYRRALHAKYRLYHMWGVDLFARTVFLWGGEHRYASGLSGRMQRLREQLLDHLRERKRLSVHDNSVDATHRYLREIARFRPAMLYGFSQAVHLLAQEAVKTGFRCNSLRLVVLTSEVATASMVASVRRAFGVPVIAEYGATECPLIAGQAPDETWRVREDQVLVETLPGRDDRFALVLTVLTNESFPLLRYAIEDTVERPIHRPDVGFAVLPAITGRQDELVLSGQGTWIHAAALDLVFETDPAVRRYRVHQAIDGSVRALIEVSTPLSAERHRLLNAALAAAVPGQATAVDVVHQIPLTSGGKHRVVSSELFARGGESSANPT